MLNKIINIVEDNITTSPKELPYILEEETTYSNRQLSEAFNMLTGTSIKSYHTIRRLEYAAEKLMSGNAVSLADLAQEICYNDQAAFANAFKKHFNITPSEAKSSNIVTRGKMKINISVEWGDKTIAKKEEAKKESNFFDIPEDKLAKIQQFWGLAAFYGMSYHQANIAYKLFKKYEIDLDSCFEFVADYFELCTWDIVQSSLSVTKFIKSEYHNDTYIRTIDDVSPEYIDLYKRFNMLPTEAFELIDSYYKAFGCFLTKRITERHIDLFRALDDNKYEAKEIEAMISDASEYSSNEWNDFLKWVSSCGVSGYFAVNEYEDEQSFLSESMDLANDPFDDSYDDYYYPNYEENYEDYRPFDYFGDDEEVNDEVDGELAGLSIPENDEFYWEEDE